MNGPTIVWSTIQVHIITMPPHCCLLLATSISELDKINPLVYLSGPSNVIQDSSVKITVEMSIYLYFWAQIWCFKIFVLVRGDCCGDFFFLQILNLKVLSAFCLWFTQLQPFQRSKRLSKVIVLRLRFSLRSSQVLKAFFLLRVLNLVIFFNGHIYCSMISAKLL